jgi:two-component system, OmpR family, phosphate regulon sensor histidine kinase PhoR
MWPALTILLFLALVTVYLRGLRQLERTQQVLEGKASGLRESYEDKLDREKIRHQALFDSMLEGFLLLDRAGRVRLTNRAFRELFSVEGEVRGKTPLEVLRVHELADLINRLPVEKRVLGHELRLAGPPERFIEINAATIPGPYEQPDGAILVFHDLTGLKRLEKARVEFVANVSHELRTPLSMIKGSTETLLDGAKSDPAAAERFLKMIERHSSRLETLVEDLLTISELESGRVQLSLQPVALRAAAARALEDYESKAAAKQVRLRNEVPDLHVPADANRLQQVLGNLLDNAIKYGRQDGTVILSGRTLGKDGVEISVRDDGPGLPPEALGRVFERFYRVDKARSRDQGGTGLGLSIVKHIVQAHGGEVRVESVPGAGATFFFTLPWTSHAEGQQILI